MPNWAWAVATLITVQIAAYIILTHQLPQDDAASSAAQRGPPNGEHRDVTAAARHGSIVGLRSELSRQSLATTSTMIRHNFLADKLSRLEGMASAASRSQPVDPIDDRHRRLGPEPTDLLQPTPLKVQSQPGPSKQPTHRVGEVAAPYMYLQAVPHSAGWQVDASNGNSVWLALPAVTKLRELHGSTVSAKRDLNFPSMFTYLSSLAATLRPTQPHTLPVICQTGFSDGFMSALLLSSNPLAHLYVFDELDGGTKQLAATKIVADTFPDRLHLVTGASPQSIKNFAAGVPASWVHGRRTGGKVDSTNPQSCDLIMIDSSDLGLEEEEMVQFQQLSSCSTILIDDHGNGNDTVTDRARDWKKHTAQGLVREIGCLNFFSHTIAKSNRLCLGRYHTIIPDAGDARSSVSCRDVRRDSNVNPAGAPTARGSKMKYSVTHNHVFSIGMFESNSLKDFKPAAGASNPVLTAADVTDLDAAFVADPFLVPHLGTWYLFFEVWNRQTRHGDISVASSKDGLQWHYEQRVLDEPFHLSYPYTFLWEGIYYMIPETHGQKQVRLYVATAFPFAWKLRAVLLEEDIIDASICHHNGHWFMFGSIKKTDNLHLYVSDQLQSGWRTHPRSPIATDNNHNSRPGGAIVAFVQREAVDSSALIVGTHLKQGGAAAATLAGQLHDRGIDGAISVMDSTDSSTQASIRLVRFGQDCTRAYGWKVQAFIISELTPTNYAETHIGPGDHPILHGTFADAVTRPEHSVNDSTPTPSVWNLHGMHQVSAAPRILNPLNSDSNDASTWLVAVDGWLKGPVAYGVDAES